MTYRDVITAEITLANYQHLQFPCTLLSFNNPRRASLLRSSGIVGRKEFLKEKVS